jgi:hypothetical protein
MKIQSVVKRLAGVPFVAIALALLGLQLTAGSMENGLTPYDEGLLVTNGMLIGHGQIPYRDFYSNYPPGSFLLVELCSWLGHGGAMHPMRVTAFCIRVAGAAFAAIVAGRMTKGRARMAAFAAILLMQSRVSLTMLAYVTAVTLALAAMVALPADRSASRWRYATSGVLFGLMTWFRHDLAVYMVPTFGALALLARLVGRPVVGALPREGKKAFAIAFLGTAVPFWLLVLGLGGPSQVLHDLVLDQAKYIQPARVLPLPSFSGEAKIGLFEWTVPSPLVDYVPLGLLALGAGIVFAALLALVQLRPANLPATLRLATLLALTLAIATAPQALQRTDSFHVGYVAPAALACLFGALGAVPAMGEALLFAAFLPFVASHPGVFAPHALLEFLHPRPDDRYFDSDEKLTAAVIRRITKPEDRIFVGCTSHRRIIIDHVSLYYVAKRLGATRYLQFDPGTVTRDDVQETMVKELEAHPPGAVVLTGDCYWDEPNASRNVGSDRLDRYLAEHFVHYEQHGPFDTLKPR